MPIYCYKCKSCGKKIEVLQKSCEISSHICPTCNGLMEKIISPVGIIFKGSGFHITDYKKDSKGGQKVAREPEGDTDTARESVESSKTGTEKKEEVKADKKESRKKKKKEVA